MDASVVEFSGNADELINDFLGGLILDLLPREAS